MTYLIQLIHTFHKRMGKKTLWKKHCPMAILPPIYDKKQGLRSLQLGAGQNSNLKPHCRLTLRSKERTSHRAGAVWCFPFWVRQSGRRHGVLKGYLPGLTPSKGSQGSHQERGTCTWACVVCALYLAMCGNTPVIPGSRSASLNIETLQKTKQVIKELAGHYGG